jgi:hypothetical protein
MPKFSRKLWRYRLLFSRLDLLSSSGKKDASCGVDDWVRRLVGAFLRQPSSSLRLELGFRYGHGARCAGKQCAHCGRTVSTQQFHSLEMGRLAETVAVPLGKWSGLDLVFNIRNIH